MKKNDATAADLAVAQWALTHDIPPHAMQGPYWRQLNQKLTQVSPPYSPMYPRKIFSAMLPQLKAVADKDQLALLVRTNTGLLLDFPITTKI